MQNGTRIAAGHAIVRHQLAHQQTRRAAQQDGALPNLCHGVHAIARDTLPDALYWDMADPYHYVRLHPGSGKGDYLIAGGEDHKTGEADDGAERFGASLKPGCASWCPSWARRPIAGRARCMTTLDHCGYIGRDPDDERVFVATGDFGPGDHTRRPGRAADQEPDRVGLEPLGNRLRSLAQVRQGDRHLHQRERDRAQELRGVPAAERARVRRGAEARRGRHPDRRPEAGWQRAATGTARCTSGRACARIWDATSTGTRPNSAGIARVTGRSSRRTAQCSTDRPCRHWKRQRHRSKGSAGTASLPQGRACTAVSGARGWGRFRFIRPRPLVSDQRCIERQRAEATQQADIIT